ncbi:hypothetical protein OG604_50300 [Streptomyces sp. NBC_01231]|nr:hypothetical protein OG604_50300 [Streptomyces sp. NBC_01231]
MALPIWAILVSLDQPGCCGRLRSFGAARESRILPAQAREHGDCGVATDNLAIGVVFGFIDLCAAQIWDASSVGPGRNRERVRLVACESGSRRTKEQDTWAKEVFPAVHEPLRQAAAEIEPGTPAQAFIEALTEL